MKAFKGFNQDLTCRDFQYEVGKTYKIDTDPIRCTENGFHSCLNPLDIFGYYNPSTSKFHEVEANGKVDKSDDDSKIASSEIKIGAEMSIKSLIDISIKFIFEKCKKTKLKHATGDRSASSATGDQSASSATGYQSASLTVGDYSISKIVNSEDIQSKNSGAIGWGINTRVSATKGNWLVLAEWDKDNKNIIKIHSVKVDGKKIKADTLYKIENGKFVIAD